MSDSIKLSKKHGVNPMLILCYFCGKEKGVALLGALPKDAEAPHKGVIDKEPCDQCKEFMRLGVILIEIRNGSNGENPYRAGGWCVVKEDAIRRMPIDESKIAEILRARVTFIETETWDALGIPRGNIPLNAGN